MPNVELKIVDKNKDGIGEIAVKAPNVMLGYYEDEEATNSAIKNRVALYRRLWICRQKRLCIYNRKKEKYNCIKKR